MSKTSEKEKAVALRKQGKTYSEIMVVVPVAKSTISLRLRDVGLAKRQIQRITEKRKAGQKRAAAKRREQRLTTTAQIFESALLDIPKLTTHDLWLFGTALHWAEGAKEKNYGPGVGLRFGNSDARMITLYLHWLEEVLGVGKESLIFRIYLHETSRDRLGEVKRYWAKAVGVPSEALQAVTWKKAKVLTKRHNTGQTYFGLLELRVRQSTNLQRKVTGWVNGVCNYWGIV